MSNTDIINKDAEILSDMADISIEDATKMLLEAMEKYNFDISESEINRIVDKLNDVELS